MIEINASTLQKSLDLCVAGVLAVDSICTLVVPVCVTSNHKVRIRDNLECIRARLLRRQHESDLEWRTHQINDVTEVNLDATFIEVRVAGGIMNELRDSCLTHLDCAETEHK